VVAVEQLRGCPALASLPDRRLRAAARASSEETYQAGQAIPMREDRLYVLQEGKVMLSVWLWPGSSCGGEAVVVVDEPGHLFGWRPVAREERLAVQAFCQTPTRLIAIDLSRLRHSETGQMLRECAVACLYALLQDLGLCPPSTADREVLGAEECQWTDADILVFRAQQVG
jgi:CRP-like cAMP-binding protein